MSELSTEGLRGMAFNMMQRYELTSGYAQSMNQAADEIDILRNKLIAEKAMRKYFQDRVEQLEAELRRYKCPECGFEKAALKGDEDE